MKDFSHMKYERYLLREQLGDPDELSYLQSLSETLELLRPATVKERRLVDISKKHIKEISRLVKRRSQQIKELEERLSVLEETKTCE